MFKHCLSIVGLHAAAFDQGIEWLVVKGIADFADESTAVAWQQFGSVMAASVVFNFLSDANVFSEWPHYQGKQALRNSFDTHFLSGCDRPNNL